MTSVSNRRAGSTERRFRGALRLVATLGIEHPLDALDRLLGVLGVAEGGEPDIALAGRPEAGAGGGDDVRLLQKAVEVQQGDTPKSLQQRVMEEAEWKILPQAIDLIAQGRVTVVDGKTIIAS